MENTITFGDNLTILKDMPSESVDLIYYRSAFQHRACTVAHADQNRAG